MPTKILAIDDSKTMRLAIKITFAAEEAEVTAVSKGSEAIARAKQMGADIVLVDANLAAGEPSGYDVCEQLNGDADTAKIPVIVLVSSQTGADAARLKRCGADGSIAKPFDTQ
jgi:CheY-like chemotaxis protein